MKRQRPDNNNDDGWKKNKRSPFEKKMKDKQDMKNERMKREKD